MSIYKVFISKRKAHPAFVCRRTVNMAAANQLKLKYDQDKFGAVHVVNDHRVVRKIQNATPVKCPQVVHYAGKNRITR